MRVHSLTLFFILGLLLLARNLASPCFGREPKARVMTLSVEKVKDNMRLVFIEKFFTNDKIGTSVQIRYLRFKGMLYESESYLCDINCVQLWKALTWFQCGNT